MNPSAWLDARDCDASGSDFSTQASAAAGSKTITLADAGDFRAGQGVMVSACRPGCTRQSLWGPRGAVAMGKPLEGKAEIRGYDGTQGDWVVLLLDVAEGSRAFRWSEDRARTWRAEAPITGDWQPLRDGLEVRFNPHDWEKGYTVHFTLRGQLATVIEKVEGNTVTLRDAPTRTVSGATLRHADDEALQAALDRALNEQRNLYLPAGRYRLTRGLSIRQPRTITVEGAAAADTVLDISEGEGACLRLEGGLEVTLRNLTFAGHSGFAERDQCGFLHTRGSSYFWGFGAKGCNALTIGGTERVLVENCHGRRMATECFVSGSRSRGRDAAPNPAHCKQTTYLRCSAIDCARNAFNDVMCGSENTCVLNCRIVDVGGCAWEGASRFVRFEGNYVRNAGTVAMGNLGAANHDDTFPELGAGQHLIAGNVFESVTPYGLAAIAAAVGATQLQIVNNRFVNFGSSAVWLAGHSDGLHYPTATGLIAGNQFDMTEVRGASAPRVAIEISASDVSVGDNQIYVRGACDRNVTAIRILEPALNIILHDNLIRNCGEGIAVGRDSSTVARVFDDRTFSPDPRHLPLDDRSAVQAEGWTLAWLTDKRPGSRPVAHSLTNFLLGDPLAEPGAESVIESVTGAARPEAVRVALLNPRAVQAGDRFEVVAPAANWTFHDNTLTDCLRPVVLDGYGGPTSVLRHNTIVRVRTTGVQQAVELRGRFALIGNLLVGFDEPDSAAIALYPDPLDRAARARIRGNTAERCTRLFRESRPGLLDAADAGDNQCDS